MPRTSTSDFRKYYKEHDDGKRMVCQVSIPVADIKNNDEEMSMCGHTTTNHNTNLKRHIAEKHGDIFKIIEAKKKLMSSSLFVPQIGQQGLDRYFESEHRVRVSYYQYLLSVLKWVTVDGRPLDLVNDAGFSFLKDILKQIPNTPVMNKANIRKLIHNAAGSIRMKITKAFKDNHISIKLDGGEYHGRKFLGIMAQTRNLQNIKEFSSFTLGCVELFESSTSANIKRKLIETLSTFGVSDSQIVSITTDGARNYLNVAKLFNHDVATDKDNSDDEFEFDDLEVEEFVIMDDTEDSIFEMKLKLNECKRLKLESLSMVNVIRIRCLAHLLQLAVHDFIESIPLSYSNAIGTARETIINCRKFNVKLALKKEGCSYLSLDVPTRWNSTYDMINRLVKNKDVLEKCSHLFPEYSMSPKVWSRIITLHDVLRECYELTVVLSRADLLPTNAYIRWMETRFKLRQKFEKSPELPKQLECAMRSRESECFATSDFNVMRFLDPRLKDGITRSEKETVVKVIYEMYARLFGNQDMVAGDSTNAPDPEENQSEDQDSAFDDFLLGASAASLSSMVGRQTATDWRNALEFEILGYINEKKLPPTDDVLQFWKNNERVYKRLYKIATLFFQIPLTEVNVERLFSHVKFILDPLRTSLSADLLNEITLIRMNIHLFEEEHIPLHL